MKFTTTHLSGIAGLLLATQGHAFEYSDIDILNQYVGHGGSYSNNFSIVQSDGSNVIGYNKNNENITSATASFVIYDDQWLDGQEGASVTLDLLQLDSDSENSWFSTFTLGGTLAVDFLARLASDGKLEYKVTSTGGDFVLKSAELTVTTTPKLAQSVPDGGNTVLLLGATLLGLAALRQKFAPAA
jgi:hypothetical protein